MSKGSFQTPASFRDELLRQSLLSEAFDAKRYYQDGFYKPETEAMQSAKNQGQLYNRIDQLGYKISSEQYRENTTEGKFLRDTTARETKQLTDQIEQSFRTGSMSPQTYNDLLGYMSEVFQSAQTGEFTRRKSSNITSEMEVPSELIQRLIGMNLTGMTTQQISKILKELGATHADVRKILDVLKNRTNTTQAQSQTEAQSQSQAQSQTEAQSQAQSQTEAQSQTPVLDLMRQVRKDGGGGATVIDDSGANISVAPNISRQGEINNFDTVENQQPDPEGDIENALTTGASASQLDRNRTDAEISRRLLEAEEGMTTRFGLSQPAYNDVDRDVNELIITGLRRNIPLQRMAEVLTKLASETLSKNPDFDSQYFIRSWLAVYENKLIQQQNQKGGGNTAAEQSGNQYSALQQEDANAEMKRQGYVGGPHNPSQSAGDAARGNVPFKNQVAAVINAQESTGDFNPKIYLNNINEKQLPSTSVDADIKYIEIVVQQIDNLAKVQKNLDDATKDINYRLSKESIESIKQMRAIVPLNVYNQLLNRAEESNVTQYSEFKQRVASLNVEDATEKSDYNYIFRVMTSIRRKTIKAIEEAMVIVGNGIATNPLAWKLRLEMLNTEAHPDTVINSSMKQIHGNKSLESNELSRSVARTVSRSEESQRAADAAEADILFGEITGQGRTKKRGPRDDVKKIILHIIHASRTGEYQIAALDVLKNDIMADRKMFGLTIKDANLSINDIETIKKELIKKERLSGGIVEKKEFYKIGAPAMTAEIPDPPMRFIVGNGRREKMKHDIIMQ